MTFFSTSKKKENKIEFTTNSCNAIPCAIRMPCACLVYLIPTYDATKNYKKNAEKRKEKCRLFSGCWCRLVFLWSFAPGHFFFFFLVQTTRKKLCSSWRRRQQWWPKHKWILHMQRPKNDKFLQVKWECQKFNRFFFNGFPCFRGPFLHTTTHRTVSRSRGETTTMPCRRHYNKVYFIRLSNSSIRFAWHSECGCVVLQRRQQQPNVVYAKHPKIVLQ